MCCFGSRAFLGILRSCASPATISTNSLIGPLWPGGGVDRGGRPSRRASGKETDVGLGVDLTALERARRAMRRNCITYFHSGRFVPSGSPLLYTNDVIKYWFEFVKQRNVWTFCWRLADPLVMIFWMQLESWAALLSVPAVRSPTHIGMYSMTIKLYNMSKPFILIIYVVPKWSTFHFFDSFRKF